MNQPPHDSPSPERVFQVLNAYQQSAALKAALELNLFSSISAGATTAAALADKVGASERGARILADYLTVQGLLTKTDGRYGLTPEAAAFLDQRSPAYLGTMYRFLLSPMITQGFDSLTEAVRQGGTAIPEDGTLAPDHPVWVEFARSMAPMIALVAERTADVVALPAGAAGTVLDVACGHGLFGITLAKRCPGLQVIAQDWAPVLEVAKENAARAGISGRHRLLAGSAFDVDFGEGHLLALVTNFLHHFEPEVNEKLLRKVHGSLAPDGRAVVVEFVPNPDRVTPPVSAAFALQMLAGTPRGDAYTYDELDAMGRNAGFAASELFPLEPSPQFAAVFRK